jgi:AMMECR1 domain-containing protein
MNQEKNTKINNEMTQAIAHFRKKLPITTIERASLLQIARNQLKQKLGNTKITQKPVNTFSSLRVLPDFIFVSLLEKNKVLVCLGSPIHDANLPLTVKNITNELLDRLRKKDLKRDQYFEIELLFDPKDLSPSKKEFNSGIHAINIKGTNVYFKSSVSINQSWHLDKLLNNLLQKANLSSSKETKFIYFKTITFKEDILHETLNPPLYDLYRQNELVFQSEITLERIECSFNNAIKYLESVLNRKNPLYLYNSLKKQSNTPCFIHEWIRVLASFWALLETSTPDKKKIISIMNMLKKNEAYSTNSFFEKMGVIDLGTNAITMLIEQILKEKYCMEISHNRAEFLLNFIKKDGSFYTFIKDSHYHTGNDHQYFLPFMAMIALIREYHHSDHMSKIEDLCLPYYLNFYNKSNKDQKMAMSLWICRVLFELNIYTSKDSYAQEIFLICDSLLEYQNYPLDENVDLFGSFTNDFTTCTTAVILETLSFGLTLLSKMDKIRNEKYRQAIQCGMRYLIQMQYTKHNSFDELAIGGFQLSPFNKEIRIDVVQHAVLVMKNFIDFTQITPVDG